MGVIITKYAFPKDVPKYDYTELLGDKFRELTVRAGRKYLKICAAVYDSPKETDFTIIYSHGNGETLYFIHFLMEEHCASLNANIIAYDWEGYGISEGKANESTLNRSSEVVLEYAAKIYPHTKIIAWGRSIGSVAAAFLGSMNPKVVSAVVLQSPMASAFSVVCSHPCCSCLDELKNFITVRNISCYVYLIHGDADSIVPYSNSLRIFESYKESAAARTKIDDIWHDPGCEEVVVMKNLSMTEFYKMRFYTVINGGHNNLETARRHQLYHVLEVLFEELRRKVDELSGNNIFNIAATEWLHRQEV